MKKKLPLSDEEFASRRDTFLKEFSSESDRGLVLISAALLEENLEMLLRSLMRKGSRKLEEEVIAPLFRSDGPLGSFASKTRLCYANELIDEVTFRDLTTIRSIRNDFAHSYVEAKLGTPSVRDRIMVLETGTLFEDSASKGSDVFMIIDAKGERGIAVAEEKRRFLVSVIVLTALLEGATRSFREMQDARYGKPA